MLDLEKADDAEEIECLQEINQSGKKSLVCKEGKNASNLQGLNDTGL